MHVCNDKEQYSNTEKSKEVCRHWRRGNCRCGESCGFSHVGHQLTESVEHISTNSTRVPACKHDISCKWLARGICSYFHKNVGVQKPWISNDNSEKTHKNTHPSNNPGDSQPSGMSVCRYGARCHKVPKCTFLHSLADFPTLQTVNQQYRPMKTSNRRQ